MLWAVSDDDDDGDDTHFSWLWTCIILLVSMHFIIGGMAVVEPQLLFVIICFLSVLPPDLKIPFRYMCIPSVMYFVFVTP
jgi:hypothetical protein